MTVNDESLILRVARALRLRRYETPQRLPYALAVEWDRDGAAAWAAGPHPIHEAARLAGACAATRAARLPLLSAARAACGLALTLDRSAARGRDCGGVVQPRAHARVVLADIDATARGEPRCFDLRVAAGRHWFSTPAYVGWLASAALDLDEPGMEFAHALAGAFHDAWNVLYRPRDRRIFGAAALDRAAFRVALPRAPTLADLLTICGHA